MPTRLPDDALTAHSIDLGNLAARPALGVAGGGVPFVLCAGQLGDPGYSPRLIFHGFWFSDGVVARPPDGGFQLHGIRFDSGMEWVSVPVVCSARADVATGRGPYGSSPGFRRTALFCVDQAGLDAGSNNAGRMVRGGVGSVLALLPDRVVEPCGLVIEQV